MDTLKTLNPLNKGTGTVIEALDSTMKKMGMGTEGQKRAESELPPLPALHSTHWLLLTHPKPAIIIPAAAAILPAQPCPVVCPLWLPRTTLMPRCMPCSGWARSM
jgi:hypothetical protein